MEQYIVTGMSCAACSARVEKSVSAVDGVTQCSVNLLTNSMTVEGDVSSDVVIQAVKSAGYGACLADKIIKKDNDKSHGIMARLVSSCILLVVLMYFSMGYTMWHFPLPSVMVQNPLSKSQSEYGYSCIARLVCIVYLQRVCAVCYGRQSSSRFVF